MDWMKRLEERLQDPINRQPYELAVAIEGSPLPWGRQTYAISDVLGIEPGDLMVDLRKQFHDDEEKVSDALNRMEAACARACT